MGDHVFSETAALAQEVPEFKLTKQVKTTSVSYTHLTLPTKA